MAKAIDSIMVCQDCLQAIVNDDYTGLDYSYGYVDGYARVQAIQSGIARLTAGDRHLAGGDDEVEFSKWPCECCGERLAGSRHEIVIMK